MNIKDSRNKHPDIFDNKLHKHKDRRGKKEHLSFNYIKGIMEGEHVYRRHKGAWRQVR